MTFSVNDPVHVERESQPKLEGAVAYVGPVKFADGDDWVGVQLTGSSFGLGKNDGTVQGERYFTCGANCGVFVRAANVVPRILSKLDQIKLKRELLAPRSSAAAASTTTTITSPSPRRTTSSATARTPARTPAGTPQTKTATATSSKTPTTSTQSRLDEIRARRTAAVASVSTARANTRAASPVKAASPKPSAVSSRSTSPVPPTETETTTVQVQQVESNATSALQIQVQELQSNLASLQSSSEQVSTRLKAKEEEAAALQQSLSKTEQDAHDSKQQVEQLQDQLKAKGQTVIQVSSDKMHQQVEELQLQESKMQEIQSELQDAVDKLQLELKTTKQDLSLERQGRVSEIQELTKTRADLATVQHDLNAINSQTSSRSTSDASHYKERAKLQAELAAIKRANEALQAEKLDMEAALEDLTLDKEQLLEEKEAVEDRVEELRIDAETAQMEVEELKGELEEAKEGGDGGGMADTDDAAQALATQNARLREALIRLREQSSFEKVETSRQLRVAEKEASDTTDLKKELETLKALKTSLDEQVGFLKETVDQGSAFETMVEDLSDRVMDLEDENVALQSTIREMEEAADIAAELEEVQAEEVKSLMMDLEGRDSIVRNLEEAIKMQRRREEDFQRTVGNYRNSVETLKQEKNELLAMQRGGEGEKSEMIATSQKALTRAAQLVADAANARKREAEHAFQQVEGDVQRHLSMRIESMLPQSVVSAELAAIKGELLLCKVVGKASMTLDGLSVAFSKTIRSGINEAMAAEESKCDAADVVAISDEAAQDIERLLHETKFSLSAIEMSSDLLRVLAAGQWPEVLSSEESAELGSALLHTLSDLDATMGSALKVLKEEGILSPHRSNLGAFQQSIQTSSQALKSVRNVNDKPLLADDWKPLAWQVFKHASNAKFSCLGSGAAIATVLNDDQSESGELVKSRFKNIMTKLEQVAGQASRIGPRMSQLDVSNEKVVTELEGAALMWKNSSDTLVESVAALFANKGEVKLANVSVCEAAADVVLKAMAQFMSSLRAADLNAEDEVPPHPLSCEGLDPWAGMSNLTQNVRSVDGDADDVNFIVRTSSIEQRLVTAVESEPKLATANTKIATLEKNLSSRSKEIAMQNARLSELEKVLAKSSVQAPTRAQKSATVTEELMQLKEENRVLADAMDVMQQQVDDYESEIRTMKDPKSPKARVPTGRTPRRNTFASPDLKRGGPVLDVDASPAAIAALQATLFRPALDAMRREAAVWKANAVAKDILSLPPLCVPGMTRTEAETKEEDPGDNIFSALEAARAALRLEKASFRLVDLSAKAPPRSQLLEALSRTTLAEEKLREAAASASSALAKQGKVARGPPGELGDLLGRIKFAGNETQRKTSLAMTKEDMTRLHLQMIQ